MFSRSQRRCSRAARTALVLADTIGVAVPGAVRALVSDAASLGSPVGGHFHNTRNTGYANALAALEAGASVLDASVGGLGGCPFAPNATGNIATEDLVYALHREGVATGIDLDGLIEVAAWLAEILGRRLDGQLYRAGLVPGLARRQDRPAHLAELDSPARPRSTTSSPSSRNVRSEPSSRRTGRSPFHVSSMSEPSDPCSAPEIVPDAKRSPVRIEAPFTVA